MHGYITRDDRGLVGDVRLDGDDVTFTTKGPIAAGRYELHVLGVEVVAVRVLSSARIARDGRGAERWAHVAERTATTMQYPRAPGPERVPT
jgi:hypothetical protein